MIQALGDLSGDWKRLVIQEFSKFNLVLEFTSADRLADITTISFDKNSTLELTRRGINYFNWDLLFSVLGPNDSEGEVLSKLNARIKILCEIKKLKSRPTADEVHGSIRVQDLAKSAKFYTWLFGVEPVEWTHRYVIFKREDIKLNFVLLISDGISLNHDTLYHLGMGVGTKENVIDFYHSAIENSFLIDKPPRTTWRGTPLHEMWLKDPDGTLIEIYARLAEDELKLMPKDKEPLALV